MIQQMLTALPGLFVPDQVVVGALVKLAYLLPVPILFAVTTLVAIHAHVVATRAGAVDSEKPTHIPALTSRSAFAASCLLARCLL